MLFEIWMLGLGFVGDTLSGRSNRDSSYLLRLYILKIR